MSRTHASERENGARFLRFLHTEASLSSAAAALERKYSTLFSSFLLPFQIFSCYLLFSENCSFPSLLFQTSSLFSLMTLLLTSLSQTFPILLPTSMSTPLHFSAIQVSPLFSPPLVRVVLLSSTSFNFKFAFLPYFILSLASPLVLCPPQK